MSPSFKKPSLLVSLVLAAALASVVLPAQPAKAAAPDSPMVLRVRDAMTGLSVPGVKVEGVDPKTQLTAVAAGAGSDGLVSLKLPKGVAEVEVTAFGYRAMRIPPLPPKLAGPVTTVWLTPDERPEELRPEVLEARRLPNMTMLHGRVVDLATGRAVAGARVRLARAGTTATTGENGYFLVYAKASRVFSMEDVPDFDDLIVEMPGFTTVRLAYLPMLEQDAHFIVDLERGEGVTVRDGSHKMWPRGVPLKTADPATFYGRHFSADQPDLAAAADRRSAAGDLAVRTKASWSGLQVLDPPDEIFVVGYGWFYLEVYVARGLCAEWIGSWGPQALDAGSIAYRSYGSWNQVNNGSICATTSCQVFNNVYVSACDLASQRTAGMVLQTSGAVARSEYSAENNAFECETFSCSNADLSCGDGSAGSPAANWSCISDAHLFDQGPGSCCFGHGRGMCQWGTQAWSRSGKEWNWMVSHYYNDEGAGSGLRTMYLTTPVEIVTAAPSPASVTPGATFTIDATLRNYADYGHFQLLLGASLTGPSTLTDPANDAQVAALARTGYTVAYRDTTVSRVFQVDAAAPAGTYDLVVPIFYDSNGNSVIDGTDEHLRTITVPGALTVTPECGVDADCDDGAFCNGEETCNAGTCQPGTDPCAGGACDEAGDVCTSVCGDATCDPGEDCNGCPADCPSFNLPAAACGNGLCEAGDGEDCVTCPEDCDGVQGGKPSGRFCCGFGGANPVGCGDARCTSSGWSCTEMPVGSGGTTCCGDLLCEDPEDGFNCAVDCGAPPVCGDATCDPGEDQCSCASDCGTPPATEAGLCGDGIDNDCDSLTDCADPDCDSVCQVDCSQYSDKTSCNAQAACNWDNKNKVCVSV